MSAWQSIETAPKNIDVLVVHGSYVFVARCVPAKTLLGIDVDDGWVEYDEVDDEYYCQAGWYRRNYCGDCDSNYSGLHIKPTHWMPQLSTGGITKPASQRCWRCNYEQRKTKADSRGNH